MENISWSDWIVAASAFITAGATVVLAIITWRYVRLTRKMLENSYKPEIVLRLLRTSRTHTYKEGTETWINPLIVEAKNIGPGVARKVTFEGHRAFNPHKIDEPPLKRVYFLNDGIDRLLPGDERKSDANLPGLPHSDLNMK